jgi:hypothetical protein
MISDASPGGTSGALAASAIRARRIGAAAADPGGGTRECKRPPSGGREALQVGGRQAAAGVP